MTWPHAFVLATCCVCIAWVLVNLFREINKS